MLSNMKSSLLKILCIFCLVTILGLWLASRWLSHYWHKPLTQRSGVSVIVPRGARLFNVASELNAQHLIDNPNWLVLCAKWYGYQGQLKYGRYHVNAGMSLADLMQNIVKGKGRVWAQVTIIEGWTFSQIRQTLANDPNVYHSLKGKSNQQIMTLMGSKFANPEGLFFPDTYHFVWGNIDSTILRSSYEKMQHILQAAWRARAKKLPYKSPYAALIVASLIESETAIDQEKPVIAGVILNRLRRKMRLQIDPTVMYGLHKHYGSTLTKRDLRKETPYNTYRIKGLPPTPIDMPSMSSIEAALHPQQTKFLYYVSKGDGSHKFSRTYKGQLAAIKKYRVKKQPKAHSTQPIELAPLYLRLPIFNMTSYLMYLIFRV